ncbi:MAG: hypothetical protein U5R06_07585 [candidate division KSB1 bacterium]|nr:hypothetical protein [candidate division KSB1 bacterium]
MNKQTYQRLYQRMEDINARLNTLRELVEQDRSENVFQKQELKRLEQQRETIENQLEDLHNRLTWERYELVDLENSMQDLDMKITRALQVFE